MRCWIEKERRTLLPKDWIFFYFFLFFLVTAGFFWFGLLSWPATASEAAGVSYSVSWQLAR